MIIGSLGKTIFACASHYLKTIDKLSITKSVSYSEHKIISKKPVLVFQGEKLDELQFEIHLNAAFNVNPLAAAKELEDYMKNGKKLRFILGGKVVGSGFYVITNLSEIYNSYTAIGTVTKMQLKITLKEYN